MLLSFLCVYIFFFLSFISSDDYLSTACNEELLECLARLREGSSTFQGNKCMIDEVIDVISLVIEAAVVAGRLLHKP